ncbi:MAG: tetratricopeptide repeat protein, partial [Planctomycetota bacterium]
MRAYSYLFMALYLLMAVLPTARAAEDVNSLLEKIYTSELEAQGKIDLFIEELAGLFKDNIRSPAAPVIYSRILDLMPMCTDPSQLDSFFLDLVQLGRNRGFPNGFLASDAQGMYYQCLLRQGKFDEAKALDAFGSFAGNLLAIGPFGFDAGSLHDMEFAPEKNQEQLESAQGLAGKVDWKRIERKPNEAGFDLREQFYPGTGCFYLLYQFRLMRDRGIFLAFVGSGSTKIWFNGEQVMDMDHRKAFLSDRIKIPLAASEGWNRVLIKLSDGDPRFTLKITDRTGYALDDLTEIKEKGLKPLASTASGKVNDIEMGSVDMLAFLESQTNLHPENAFSAAAHADILSKRGLLSKAVSEGERAVALLPDNPHLLYFLGKIYENAGYLPRNHMTNRSKELYDRTVEADAKFLPAQVALARLDHNNDRSEDAIRRLNVVLKESPRYYDAWCVLASIYDKLNWSNELLQAILEAKKLAPRDPYPHIMLAEYYQALQRHDMAFDLYRKALDLDASRFALLERVAAYLWDRGEKVEAFGLYERAFSLNDNAFNRERMAGLHRALGDPVKAREILEELSTAHPQQARYYAMLGDLAFELDSVDEAVTWYGKALEVSPQEHNLREILEDWKKIEDPLFSEFIADENEYIRNLPDRGQYPKASAICSLDHMITRVYGDGSWKSEVY